jgi:hypothetical protein
MSAFSWFWLLTALQRLVVGLLWRLFLVLYAAIGLGALGVLFRIEAEFFGQLTQTPTLGYGIAAIFAAAKVGTSTIKQILAIANRVSGRVKVSGLIRFVTVIVQFALFAVSLFCAVAVATWWLEGRTAFDAERPYALAASVLRMVQHSLSVTIHPATFISACALIFSGLLHGTMYMVFGHLIATQSREIEHLFETRFYRLDAKKNSTLSL